MMKTVLTSIFVGRREEVNKLAAILDLVQDGSGHCVLVSGEAGIGKSRLLAEIQVRAEHMDFETLAGRCFEQDRSFPYAPLVDMLRPFFGQSLTTDQLEVIGPIAPALIKLLPELTIHFSEPPFAPLVDPEIQERQLFEELTRFFWRQVESGPLLLIVEDLH
jgi:predicted ATPase